MGLAGVTKLKSAACCTAADPSASVKIPAATGGPLVNVEIPLYWKGFFEFDVAVK
jgi:hypothetical protein